MFGFYESLKFLFCSCIVFLSLLPICVLLNYTGPLKNNCFLKIIQVTYRAPLLWVQLLENCVPLVVSCFLRFHVSGCFAFVSVHVRKHWTLQPFRTSFSKERVSLDGSSNCASCLRGSVLFLFPCEGTVPVSKQLLRSVSVGVFRGPLWRSCNWQPQVRLLGSSEVKDVGVLLFSFAAHERKF